MIRKTQLSQVSLAEFFHILAQTSQTGLLTIYTQTNDRAQPLQKYYIWLLRGCIVAVANRLDGQGLISKIEQRNWLEDQTLKHLVEQCPPNRSLGMFMRGENALSSQQLKLLFYAQVVQPVCGLFKLKNGYFEFDSRASLPQIEMTGLSLSVARATLMSLRALRDWDALSNKLPKPSSVLKRMVSGKFNFTLDILERKVWELANGKRSLEAIAEELSIALDKGQQIAFCLITIGLVEEVSPNHTTFLKAGLKRELVNRKKGDRFLPDLSPSVYLPS